MKNLRMEKRDAYKKLQQKAAEMQKPAMHLRSLSAAPQRLQNYSAMGGGLWMDYSRQRLDDETVDLLLSLADDLGLIDRFNRMRAGDVLNVTENRAVLHTATREFSETAILVDGTDIMPDMRNVREQIRDFSHRLHNGEIVGSTGKPFRHAVVVGIGGSYLGTEFVSTALAAYADRGIRLHFLANVDSHNFGAIATAIEPETTLWIIISKSYTTAETMANANLAATFMRENGIDPAKHMVTVTSKGSPGDTADNPVLACFHMYDFIGGRYSVTSAVGGVPLSLLLGYDRFEAFLKGASEMDGHAGTGSGKANLPLMAALISVWNTSFLGYQQQAIIPYAAPLAKLAPHVQQLNMESNGKGADIQGRLLDTPAGTVIFGEPGTNAQHSFFQLAHQGRPFPIDFIGVLKPQYSGYTTQSKGVTNHQELWANMIAQAKALAMGQDNEDKARHFSGNRPSTTLVLKDLSPVNAGRLLAFYEARTVFEGFLWGINSFDQFGVQLGKTTASNLRQHMAGRNADAGHAFDDADPISAAYLDMLFKGSF